MGCLGKDATSDPLLIQRESDLCDHQLERPRLTPAELAACVSACLGMFSTGIVTGYSSPAIRDLERDAVLTEGQAAWFGSVMTIGAMFGGPMAGWAVGKFGRKTTVVLTAFPFVVGWFLIVTALTTHSTVGLLYVGRILTGFGAGMACLCVPLYIAEVAPKQYRGALVSGIQVGTTSGILLTYGLGMTLGWQWLAAVSAMPPSLMVLLVILVPETPRWLLMKNRRAEAVGALTWLRQVQHQESVMPEIQEIEEALAMTTSGIVPWSDFFRNPALARPLRTSILMMVFQQFCGINAVIFYTDSIFESGGFKGNPDLPAVVVAAVKATVTASMLPLIDRAGRKPLLITGGLGMGLSCVCLGVYFYLTQSVQTSATLSWLSLGSLIVYVVFYSVGWGAIPWILMSEIFPAQTRGRASGVATGVNWLCAFIVTQSFLPLTGVITSYGVFWGFAGVCFTGTLYVACCLVETKGKSLEEIEAIFR